MYLSDMKGYVVDQRECSPNETNRYYQHVENQGPPTPDQLLFQRIAALAMKPKPVRGWWQHKIGRRSNARR